MSPEGIKEEIKLNTEIIKFIMVVLLASVGGIITLYNISGPTAIQLNLITIGWIFVAVLLIVGTALFLYIYSLLKKI
jgi:hypothetical protein